MSSKTHCTVIEEELKFRSEVRDRVTIADFLENLGIHDICRVNHLEL
mgnify:CR=1 FL=1